MMSQRSNRIEVLKMYCSRHILGAGYYLTTSARGIKSPALDSAQQQWPGQSTVLSEVYKRKHITSRRRMAAV